MFAYCANNPINYVDPKGDFPWHIVIAALVGGGVGSTSALIRGEQGWNILWAGLDGAAQGALVAACPQLAAIVSSIELFSRFLKCIEAGYTFEETFAIMGLAVVGEVAIPSTGDVLTDAFVDATFGSAKDMSCEAGITAIGNSSNGKFTINNIATATSSRNGGGCGKSNVFMQSCRTVRGDYLWI